MSDINSKYIPGRLSVRIAIPIWQQRISPVFDTAERLLVLDIKDGYESSRFEQSMKELALLARVDRLTELDVDVLLCGAISRPLASAIANSGIKVIPWTRGNVNEVVQWYTAGKPLDYSRFMMPCYHAARHRRRLGGGRRKGSLNYGENNQEEIQ